MHLKSFGAFATVFRDIEEIFSDIIDTSADQNLKRKIASGAKSLAELEKIIEFFVNEGRDRYLLRSPEEEILRQPNPRGYQFFGKPIFLIGNRRSGTTLLAYLINASPNICAIPENFLVGGLVSADSVINLGQRVATFLREPISTFLSRLGEMANSIYSRYAAEQAKARWVSKELFVPHKLDLVDALFNYQAQFVYVVRHGFSVAYSCSSRFSTNPFTQNASTSLDLECYLNEWISNNESTMDFHERNSDRCTLIRYEDLLADPEAEGCRIFRFLGEAWEVDILEKMNSEMIIGMGDNKILERGGKIGVLEETWRTWPNALKRTLGRKANAMLTRLGYDPV